MLTPHHKPLMDLMNELIKTYKTEHPEVDWESEEGEELLDDILRTWLDG